MPIVYSLRNPLNNKIYYVGFTVKSATERLFGHLSKQLQPTTRQLVEQGLQPIIEVIEDGADVDKITEMYHIKRLLSEGYKLENRDGVVNYQNRETLLNIPKALRDSLQLTENERLKIALKEVMNELPLSSSTPIVIRIKTIIEWALSIE